MSVPVLDMTAVVKDYRGLRPLRIERLTLDAGARLAIMGMDAPAAEMMTTLVTAAAVPDAGAIHVLGTRTADITSSEQWLALIDRIGLVTDRAALLDMMTVIQNLALSFTLQIDQLSDDRRNRMEALATEVGLPAAVWGQPAGSLSAAHRTRLRLGRALALDPSLLLLEHPTAQVERDEVDALARDIEAVARERQIAALALTADAAFADAMDMRVLEWDPARGSLHERKRRWWPWK